MKYITDEIVKNYLPQRKRDSHKGTYGKVLVLCGSRGYTGAPALACRGALRTGAGLVYLGVPESIYSIEAVKLDEPVVIPLPDQNGMLAGNAWNQISQMLPRMDAVLFGCGIGIGAGTESILCNLLDYALCPIVLDADGITMTAKHMDKLRSRDNPTILTPHDGEFQRLAPENMPRLEQTMALAEKTGCILLRKGPDTLVTDGKRCYENTTGNPGMAAGGSGDVLAGIILSLLGQHVPPLEAAAIGAWLHGKAGDLAAARFGEYGMLPSDLAEQLPRLL